MGKLIVIGLDPGLVHTGIVVLKFDITSSVLMTAFHVMEGFDAEELAAVLAAAQPEAGDEWHLFNELYRPRMGNSPNKRMVQIEREIEMIEPTVEHINNSGVHKIVRDPLLQQLGLKSWPLRTNHQDLKSAAKTAIFGMLKEPRLNEVLADILKYRDSWEISPTQTQLPIL